MVTSPMTLVEAYDGRTTEQRWDWVLSQLRVVDIGKDEAPQARRLLADAKLHGHKYAIDAVLAVIARQQKGQVTVFTSDVDALEKLVPTQSWSRRCDPPRRVLVVNGELHTTGLRVAADGAGVLLAPGPSCAVDVRRINGCGNARGFVGRLADRRPLPQVTCRPGGAPTRVVRGVPFPGPGLPLG